MWVRFIPFVNNNANNNLCSVCIRFIDYKCENVSINSVFISNYWNFANLEAVQLTTNNQTFQASK